MSLEGWDFPGISLKLQKKDQISLKILWHFYEGMDFPDKGDALHN